VTSGCDTPLRHPPLTVLRPADPWSPYPATYTGGMRFTVPGIVLAVLALVPTTAAAQRVTFERTFEIGAPLLEIETDRGRIEVVAGEAGRVIVEGTVTVRVGWAVPADAERLASAVAAAPPIERDGNTVRLRPPAAADARRAVTVSYRLQVPPGTHLRSVSASGATAVRGLSGEVRVRTQSGAITLSSLTAVAVTTGSGAVDVDGVTGSLHAQSGSGGLRLHDVRGVMTVETQSGRVDASGTPGPWTISTGSSGVTLSIASADFTLEASSRSGSLRVEGARVDGTVEKRRVAGTIGQGGSLAKVTTGSGAIRVEVRAQ
jgi:hypothetical protein